MLTTRYNAVQVTTGSDAENTVQQIEATLSPQQMQQFQALQQQQGRHLLQGPKTQQAITTIGELNQGACHAAREHTHCGFSYSPAAQSTAPSRTRTTRGRRHPRFRYVNAVRAQPCLQQRTGGSAWRASSALAVALQHPQAVLR